MVAVAKQPNERYRMKGRTRYIGVDCWVDDTDAKNIAKLARKQGVKVLAQFDLAQGVTYLYVPESTFVHDAGVVFNLQQQLIPA